MYSNVHSFRLAVGHIGWHADKSATMRRSTKIFIFNFNFIHAICAAAFFLSDSIAPLLLCLCAKREIGHWEHLHATKIQFTFISWILPYTEDNISNFSDSQWNFFKIKMLEKRPHTRARARDTHTTTESIPPALPSSSAMTTSTGIVHKWFTKMRKSIWPALPFAAQHNRFNSYPTREQFDTSKVDTSLHARDSYDDFSVYICVSSVFVRFYRAYGITPKLKYFSINLLLQSLAPSLLLSLSLCFFLSWLSVWRQLGTRSIRFSSIWQKN